MAAGARSPPILCLLFLQVLHLCFPQVLSGECQTGRFGYNCHLDCNCAGTCNTTTGVCSGVCKTGFLGSTCQKHNVARGKKTNASAVYGSWVPSKAVDGDVRQDPPGGRSRYYCSHTAEKRTSNWWSVDLGAVFPMDNIVIYYRKGYLRRFYGATVNIANVTGLERTCTTITKTNQYTNAIVTLNCPDSGQKLILRQSPNCGECILESCEVQIFACSAGTYGKDCSSQCGRCANDSACHRTSGHCPQDCMPGWRGDNCNQECQEGNYGQACSLSCGHCSDGANCHRVDGSCPNGTCQPGYKGIKCDQECENRSYGQNCGLSCGHCSDGVSCHHVDGSCPNGTCQPGYRGIQCIQECQNGSYGQNCGVSCGHCSDNNTCHHVTGFCPSGICLPGYRGDNCHQDCGNGTFGQNCSLSCGHCSDGVSCHHVDGSCPNGTCQPGYRGDNCDQGCQNGSYGQNCSVSCGHCSDNNTCHHVTGSCPSGICLPGYRGDNCDQACNNGTYGQNCGLSCGHCSDGANCHHVDGSCPNGTCQPGYRGNNCDQECRSGRHGQNCSLPCVHCQSDLCHHVSGSCLQGCALGWTGNTCTNCTLGYFGENCTACGSCLNGVLCDVTNGSCPGGLCASGYSGPLCTEALRIVQTPNGGGGGANVGVIGGSVGAVLVVLVVLAVLAVVFLRRRSAGQGSSRKREAPAVVNSGRPEEDGDVYVNVAFRENSPRSSVSSRRGPTDDVTSASCDTNVYANVTVSSSVADVTSPSGIATSDLEETVARKKATKTFKDEYESVPDSFLADYDDSQRKEHAKKNKFRGYYPYDHNRVVLEPTSTDPNSDYINASFIDGFETKRMFIAAQAATPVTLPDFLRMIWQQQCSHVVMLTNLMEDMKVKCVRYWPESEGAELKCGQVTVTLRQQTEWSYCTLRQLRLTHEKGGSRTVKQFHFTTWPDHGVPSHVDMLDFFWKVRASWSPDSGPLLVHCSAGVGRTGTFIALWMLSDQATSQHRVDPLAILTALRHQRRNMIQTLSQYEFLHEALVRVVQLGRTTMDKEDFCSGYAGQGGGLLVGNRTLDQLAQDIPRMYEALNKDPSNDRSMYSNSTDWDYFDRSTRAPSVCAKRGFELVRLWDSETETLAPPGLWHFLLETQACLLLDVHSGQIACVDDPSHDAEGKGNAFHVEWKEPISLVSGVQTRHVVMQSKGSPDAELEYVALNMAGAEMPGCVVAVASRLASEQLASSSPIAVVYRPGEEDLVQLVCAAVNLAETLRLDGHVELVSSLLRLHASVSPTVVTKLAEIAYVSLLDDASVYVNT